MFYVLSAERVMLLFTHFYVSIAIKQKQKHFRKNFIALVVQKAALEKDNLCRDEMDDRLNEVITIY